MPPVEIESIPAVPEVEVASTLKTLDKAMELPIINDAVNMATKLHQQATQFPTYNQVEAIVTNGVEMVNAGLSEGVKSSVHTAVSSLDSLASTGLDKLTTSVPALATPTEEILPTITGTISASAATDYVASFGLVQSGLQLADTALSLGEKAVTSLAPSVEETSLAGGMIKQVRVVRRALRAIRHAGRRAGDEGSGGVTGWIMDLLHINAILGFFGLSLNKPSSDGPIATSGEESDVDETNDDETLAEKLEKDYGNESQDLDYVPSHPTEDSLEYKSDEEALEASQEDPAAEEPEASQDASQEALEASQDESQDPAAEELEASQDESQDPAAEEPEAGQDESQEALEAKSDEEALEASQDASQDPASEELEASKDESQEAEEQPAAIDEEALEASDKSQDPASEEPEASQDKAEDAKEHPAAVIEAAEVATEEQPAAVDEALEASQDKSQDSASEEVEASLDESLEAKEQPAAVDEEALEDSQDKSQDPASEELEASQDKSEEAKEQPAAVIEAAEVATEACHGESLENLDDSREDKSLEEALEQDKSQDPASEELEAKDKSEEAKEQPAAVIEAAEVATEACHGESLENEEDSELD